MISLVEIFGIIAIGFALYFIRMIVKNQNTKADDRAMDFIPSEDKTESFVDIPMEQITARIDYEEAHQLEELKEKIRRFKDRNRFYNL